MRRLIYGFLALAAVLMTIEYKYQPVAIAVDVAHYAGERIGKGHPQATAQVEPQAPRIAKVSATKPHTKTMPASLDYVVGKGETVTAVGRKYNNKVDVKATCALNDLGHNCGVKPDQHIALVMKN